MKENPGGGERREGLRRCRASTLPVGGTHFGVALYSCIRASPYAAFFFVGM